ncbi:hypothetical protein [Nonomuraea zeae]|uniref:hypothetical protein n=1 Tax=Nonomuraea zeae TaxID=1642303 RepID=UPI001478F160|nr:hypothetical protein [Nonomuraea zeae]
MTIEPVFFVIGVPSGTPVLPGPGQSPEGGGTVTVLVGDGVGVDVDVFVGVTVGVTVGVFVGVTVGVGVGVTVRVDVTVGVGVSVLVGVTVGVGVGVAVRVGVTVGVGVAVRVDVTVGVEVTVGVGVAVRVEVTVGVGVTGRVEVTVGVGVGVTVSSLGVGVGFFVGLWVGRRVAFGVGRLVGRRSQNHHHGLDSRVGRALDPRPAAACGEVVEEAAASVSTAGDSRPSSPLVTTKYPPASTAAVVTLASDNQPVRLLRLRCRDTGDSFRT